jgi:hypothetical protein
MDPQESVAAHARPAGTRDVLPLVVIAPALAAIVAALWHPAGVGVSVLAALAAGGALLVGVPALVAALDHGVTRLPSLAAIGAAAGAVVPLALLASGMLGQLARGGAAYLRWMLQYGAPLPSYGLAPWPAFVVLEVSAVATGAASFAADWWLFVRRR